MPFVTPIADDRPFRSGPFFATTSRTTRGLSPNLSAPLPTG